MRCIEEIMRSLIEKAELENVHISELVIDKYNYNSLKESIRQQYKYLEPDVHFGPDHAWHSIQIAMPHGMVTIRRNEA